MYKVIKRFMDLHDKEYLYDEGDIFPRPGLEVEKERFDELAGSNNKRGTPLIKEVEESSPEDSVKAAAHKAVNESLAEGKKREGK